jgi:hypothetical protein
MKQIAVTSTAELRHALAELDGHSLFRGQVAYYEKDGHPSVVTSFDRRGCIPSQMLKWCRYAHNVLDTYIGRREHPSPSPKLSCSITDGARFTSIALQAPPSRLGLRAMFILSDKLLSFARTVRSGP